MDGQLVAHCGTNKLTREQLQFIPSPEATETYQPLAHHDIVQALLETLMFRHISVVRDEYAVSEDGMKMFGVMDLETTFEGCCFSNRPGPHAKELRADATRSRRVEGESYRRRRRDARDLPCLRRGGSRSPEAPCTSST